MVCKSTQAPHFSSLPASFTPPPCLGGFRPLSTHPPATTLLPVHPAVQPAEHTCSHSRPELTLDASPDSLPMKMETDSKMQSRCLSAFQCKALSRNSGSHSWVTPYCHLLSLRRQLASNTHTSWEKVDFLSRTNVQPKHHYRSSFSSGGSGSTQGKNAKGTEVDTVTDHSRPKDGRMLA